MSKKKAVAPKIVSKAAPKAPAKVKKQIVGKGMLVDGVAAKLEGMPKKDVKAVLDVVLAAIVEKVSKGAEVRLVGFGTFKQSHRAACTGRNPRTGEALQIKASDAFTFKSGIKF